MKQKLIALSLVIVMVASTLTVIAATTATPVAAANPIKTDCILRAEHSQPYIGQLVTYSAQLRALTGTAWVSLSNKPLTIWSYASGAWKSTIVKTNAYGVFMWSNSWTAVGSARYVASFAGDSQYAKVTSATLVVTVKPLPTRLWVGASKLTPYINQQVTFTAQLWQLDPNSYNYAKYVALPNKYVTIYHYHNGVQVNDVAKKTDANGKITWTNSWPSAGPITYYFSFAGESLYVKATGEETIIVQKLPTVATLTVSKTTPQVNEKVTFIATLGRSSLSSTASAPLSDKLITIYHYHNGVQVNDVAKKTDANGKITWTNSWPSAGPITYYALFGGDSEYATTTSAAKAITVQKIPTRIVTYLAGTVIMGVIQYYDVNVAQWKGLASKPVKLSITGYDQESGPAFNDATSVVSSSWGGISYTLEPSSSLIFGTLDSTFAGDSVFLPVSTMFIFAWPQS